MFAGQGNLTGETKFAAKIFRADLVPLRVPRVILFPVVMAHAWLGGEFGGEADEEGEQTCS